MSAVEGKKRWTLLREEEEQLLAPNFTTKQFGVNAAAPDYLQYPLARFIRGWQHVLEPGQTLYIPSGAPHQVENLEGPTVALAGNYIDAYSMHKTLDDIERHRSYDHREANWEMTRSVLRNPAFDSSMDLSLDHIRWEEWETHNHRHHERLTALDPDIWSQINLAIEGLEDTE